MDIDTGAVILDSSVLNDLHGLIDSDEKFRAFVNEEARLSFYADFLYPLASGSTLEQYYLEQPEGVFNDVLAACRALWAALNKYRMKLIRLSPASFIHFGTTRELLDFVTKGLFRYRFLEWSMSVNTNLRAGHFAANNAYVSRSATVGEGAYVEDSYIHAGMVIESGSVVSGAR